MRLFPLALAIILASAAGCHSKPEAEKGESPIIRRAFPMGDFARINVQGPDSVIVTRGPRFAVTAEGQEWAIGTLDLRRSGDALQVGRKRWLGPTGSGAADRPVLLRITMPQLRGATLTGSGGLTVDHVRAPDFTAMLTGSGSLTARDVVVGRLIADATGAGTIHIGGKAETGHLSSQGSGSIDAVQAHIDTVSVSVTGSGNVRTASDGIANVSVLGSGNVVIDGRARCTVMRTGTGQVDCGR